MNLLLHLAAGNGDLINTTGVIIQLKAQYPQITIDFLCKKSQAYLLQLNPAINEVLHFEDYGILLKTGHPKSHERQVITNIMGYDKYINIWCNSPFDGDFPLSKKELLKKHGLGLNCSREDINGVLFPTERDLDIVHQFAELHLSEKRRKVVLIEDDSFNAKFFRNSEQLSQITSQRLIAKELLKRDFYVISNNIEKTILCSDLNLIQIKCLFELYGDIFLGLSSGITTSFFTNSDHYENKMFIIAGQPQWNYCKFIKGMKHHFFTKNYDWGKLYANFRIFDRSVRCGEFEDVERAGESV